MSLDTTALVTRVQGAVICLRPCGMRFAIGKSRYRSVCIPNRRVHGKPMIRGIGSFHCYLMGLGGSESAPP